MTCRSEWVRSPHFGIIMQHPQQGTEQSDLVLLHHHLVVSTFKISLSNELHLANNFCVFVLIHLMRCCDVVIKSKYLTHLCWVFSSAADSFG